MKPAINIVKIGGNVIDNEVLLQEFVSDFASIDGLKILVHGGGKIASELSAKMGIVPNMVEGRRITDAATLDIVTMLYAGLINKKLVVSLQAEKCNAIGMTGADGNIIPASKRAVGEIDYGFVGDIDASKVDADALSRLLDTGFTPVIAPITHDGKGQLLNTNADTIASSLGVALTKYYNVNLIYCFEKKGVLKDVNDENSALPYITLESYSLMKKEGIISKGMIPKLNNSFEAINMGVGNVWIGHASNLKKMIEGNENAGSKLSK